MRLDNRNKVGNTVFDVIPSEAGIQIFYSFLRSWMPDKVRRSLGEGGFAVHFYGPFQGPSSYYQFSGSVIIRKECHSG